MSGGNLVIRNARLLLEGRIVQGGVYVREGRIEAVGRDSKLPKDEPAIDARGNLVVPGLIDVHCHLRDPGFTHKEDYETGTRAAAAGGVTMVVDMPNTDPPTDSVPRLEEKRKIAKGKAVVDFGHWACATRLEEIQGLARAGAMGFKVYMIRGAYPHDRCNVADDATLYRSYREVGKTGLVCVTHPCNMEIFDLLSEEQWAEGRRNHVAWTNAYTDELVYSTSVSTAVYLARRAGCRIHLAHTHSADAIEFVRFAKRHGWKVTAETDPKYFVMTREEAERLGPLGMPGGLFPEDRVESVWKGLNDGTIDILSTDHAPHLKEEIETGKVDAWQSAAGNPHLEHFLSVFLTEVNRGRITLERLIKITSENPARLMGLYPVKGAIAPGSDGDFTIVDMKARSRITSERIYSKCGWTPYEGREVQGLPVCTISRGRVVMRDGEVLGKPGWGEHRQPAGCQL